MSETKVPSIPEVPANVDVGLRRFLDAVRQVIQVREGNRGDVLDSAVTFRDLVEGGLATYATSGTSGISITPTAVTDLTRPPLVDNLSTAGALTSIVVSWTLPEYKNHSHTEIWRSQSPDILQAAQVGMASGALYIDYVARNTTGFKYYYWARNVSIYGVKGEFGIVGVLGETSPDPTAILELLLGQLTESSLTDALNSRIDLVDNGGATNETVDARINSAATTINNALNAFEAEVQTTTTSLSNQIGQVSTDLTNTTNTLVAADTAIIQTIDEYKVEVEDTYATITEVNSGFANTNQAIANLNTTITARLNNAGGAGISVEQQFTAQASVNSGLLGQYTVKINNTTDRYVTGFGLAQTTVNGATVGEFAIVADRFSIAPVATNPAAADGSPFYYLTTPTVINGVTVPAGAYLKRAFIADATIGTAQIADAAITNAKIANITADKIQFNQANGQVFNAAIINGGSITGTVITGNTIIGGEISGSRIWVGGTSQYPNVEISNVTGSLRTYSETYLAGKPIRYSEVSDGNVVNFRLFPAGFNTYDYQPTKALTNIYTGVTNNGEVVVLPGFWEEEPKIIVSISSIQLYESSLNAVDQRVVCTASNLQKLSPIETNPGFFQYSFVPVITLVASASDGVVPIKGLEILRDVSGSTGFSPVGVPSLSFSVQSAIFSMPSNVSSGVITVSQDVYKNYVDGGSGNETDVNGAVAVTQLFVNNVLVFTSAAYRQSYPRDYLAPLRNYQIPFGAVPAGQAYIVTTFSEFKAHNNSSNATNTYRLRSSLYVAIDSVSVVTSSAASLANGVVAWTAIGR